MTQAAPPKVPFFCGAVFQCPKTPIAKMKNLPVTNVLCCIAVRFVL